jgi:hypothetical protein
MNLCGVLLFNTRKTSGDNMTPPALSNSLNTVVDKTFQDSAYISIDSQTSIQENPLQENPVISIGRRKSSFIELILGSLSSISRPRSTRPRSNSGRIDKEIKDESRKSKSTTKAQILLIGPCDSGKTTIIKQLYIKHGSGLQSSDQVRSNINRNILIISKLLIQKMCDLDVTIDSAWSDSIRLLSEFDEEDQDMNILPDNILMTIKTITMESHIQDLILNSWADIDFPDSAGYIFENWNRILGNGYQPSEEGK